MKRQRALVACLRCKTRRQRCDNGSPACSKCSKSGAECVYPDNLYPTSYVKTLEEKVNQLEACLARSPGQIRQDVNPQQTSINSGTPDTQPQLVRENPSSNLAAGVGLLSSCATAEPHYFGTSSGLTLAHFVEAAVQDGRQQGELSLPSLVDRPFSNQIPDAKTPLASLPAAAEGLRYIQAYLQSIYPVYPFLGPNELLGMHSMGGQGGEEEALTEAALAKIHLVYAIGSRCLQLLDSRNVLNGTPEGHYMSAMQFVAEVTRSSTVDSIEVTLLLAIHSMRSPAGASVWHLCGLAMRQCLELGFHRQRPNHDQDQRRKRLFWSLYIFDRKTALILGRPFSVSEKEVEVELPLDLLIAIPPTEDHSIDPPHSSLRLHRNLVLLYHIHTRIRFTLYRLKNASSKRSLDEKVASRFHELDEWRLIVLKAYKEHAGPFASSNGEREKAELELEYHKARRSLLQPLLTETSSHFRSSQEHYTACAESSGQICQLYRRLHRLAALPFTLRDLHAVFVAGFTLIHCICAKPALYDAHCASHLGACSTVLYVISEQWPSARKYRDAFEVVAERTIDLTQQRIQSGVIQHTGVSRQSSSSDAHQSLSRGDLEGDWQGMLGSNTNPGLRSRTSDESHAPSSTSTGMSRRDSPMGDLNDSEGIHAFRLDIAAECDKIGDLLFDQGMDWFADSALI